MSAAKKGEKKDDGEKLKKTAPKGKKKKKDDGKATRSLKRSPEIAFDKRKKASDKKSKKTSKSKAKNALKVIRPEKRAFDKSRIYEGVFIRHKKGFGFVSAETLEDDIFIPADKTKGAFHKDLVEVYLDKDASADGSYRAEGRVIEIKEHGITKLIGSFHKNAGFGFVVPDDVHISSDIYIAKKDLKGAGDGDKVIVELLTYGGHREKPEGRIKEILGKKDDKGVDITAAVRSSGVNYSFPEKVREELKMIPDKVDGRSLRRRTDFRDRLCVTIDGDDSKDFDDAVSLSYDEEAGIYELSVHIADVAEYVKEGSALDEEAKERGTSIYLPDRVIPMLPKKLSNGICSLNEGVDRLTLSCLMKIDKKGAVIESEIVEGVIKSRRRLTYRYVYSLLTDKLAARAEKDKELLKMLRLMLRLSKILRKRREREGCIDFDFPEAVIKLDEKGIVKSIERYEINDANRLIEDLMLAANETVARTFYEKGLPFLYRCHGAPDEDRAEELRSLVTGLGISVRRTKNGLKDPKAMQRLLKKAEGTPEGPLIERVALRTMQKAVYSPECMGHYGLAKRYYTHFTSPIRRYPDLQIHRIIKEYIKREGRLKKAREKHYEEILPKVAIHSSDAERKADELERNCDKLKKCEYLSRFIGKRASGIISGVTNHGFYVELPDTCEGMVHVASLRDDHYDFDEKKLRLIGERRGRVYSLGDKVDIVISAVDKAARTIDFRLP